MEWFQIHQSIMSADATFHKQQTIAGANSCKFYANWNEIVCRVTFVNVKNEVNFAGEIIKLLNMQTSPQLEFLSTHLNR